MLLPKKSSYSSRVRFLQAYVRTPRLPSKPSVTTRVIGAPPCSIHLIRGTQKQPRVSLRDQAHAQQVQIFVQVLHRRREAVFHLLRAGRSEFVTAPQAITCTLLQALHFNFICKPLIFVRCPRTRELCLPIHIIDFWYTTNLHSSGSSRQERNITATNHSTSICAMCMAT